MPFLDRNKWRVRIWVNGQKFSKTFPEGTPKKIAGDYERKLKLSQIDPDLAEKRRLEPLFAEFAQRWLDEHCAVRHSVSYLKKCRQVVGQHLNTSFGSRKIREVTSQDLLTLQRALHKDAYAVQSISNILATASAVFKVAVLEGLVDLNPCSGIQRLKKGQRPELEVWTLEERDRYLGVLFEENFKYFQVCAVALFTGLRPSELRGLLRDAIDFDRCQVRVHRQWCTKQNQLVPYTKTREARTVPIPRPILEYLLDKRCMAGDAQIFPFLCNSFGHVYLKPLMKKAGVRQIRMHDFRHTFASHMLLQGASLVEVKELLGHRKLESTTIYLHYIPDRNLGATDKLLGRMPWSSAGEKVVAMVR